MTAKKIIYFTVASEATAAEKLAIDRLNALAAPAYTIAVRNGAEDAGFSGTEETCDLVAGTVPTEFQGEDAYGTVSADRPVLFEAFPKTLSLATGADSQIIAIATTGLLSDLEGEDVTAECTFASSVVGKATVSGGGLIHGVSTGTTNVTVTYEYKTGLTSTFVIPVTVTA